jgi:hypothetical protein
MAVTYIRRFAAGGGDAAGGGGTSGGRGAGVSGHGDATKGNAFRRRCRDCDTRYVIGVSYARIQVDVKGPTCHYCDPAAFSHAEEPAAGRPGGVRPPGHANRPERAFKVWVASQDHADPRVEVRDIPADRHVAERVECRAAGRMDLRQIIEQGEGAASSTEQRAKWAEDVVAKLGAAAWRTVEPAWQEKHCDILAALAEALDHIWVIVRAGGSLAYRVIVRLDGFPEIVNALAAEIAGRSIAARYGPPLPIMADQFRQAGVAICAATDMGACASLGATAERMAIAAAPERLAVIPDRELIQSLIDKLDLPASWDGRKLLPLENAFQLLVASAAQPAFHTEPLARLREPEGRLELTLEHIRESRELDTVTRPLTFGDTGG